jgi:hypothetical protein
MKVLRLTLWLALAALLSVPASFAQAPPVPAPQSPPHPILDLPPAKSPVELFRELLAMPRAERENTLATRPPEARRQIMAKLREYETLRPEQRELRLKSTELRWYLLPLMQSSPTNRVMLLDRIPPEDRDLVTARLKEWDALPAQVQQELLQNEATIQYFTELRSGSPPAISPARRQKLEAGIAQWRALPEDRRREIAQRFNQFFDLKPEEKSRVLSALSPAERRQIEKTLKSFERLPEVQRQQCIDSFEKFANLSLIERQEFLKNAERWKLMSPEERQSWRELVSVLSSQPPLPPGVPGRMPPPPRHDLPPLPKAPAQRPGS